MSLPLPAPMGVVHYDEDGAVVTEFAYTESQLREYGQTCRDAALTDVVVLATSGASYLEIMDFLRRELEDLK